jgi:hypothetical protein
MPQQLIYTSAPRGIVAGRSGYCTVARSATMREALMLQLERFSYYQHLSLSGGRERPIFTCRAVDLRGSRFQVLSQIQDAGLDFTGRTNFIAHHLVFAPEEIQENAMPPVILRDWIGWAKSWTKEPELLENEDWTGLAALMSSTNVPAQTWQRVTGDGVNGYGLLEARAGTSFSVDDVSDEDVLGLFAESLELLQVRGTRRDVRTSIWNYTFTTSMQEQDNPADFRWRCFHADNPVAARFATPDCRVLSAVRATKSTAEEMAFARMGVELPRFVAELQDQQIGEGQEARFRVEAAGVPTPTYQWFSVDRAGNAVALAGEINSELVVKHPPQGISRYSVSAANSAGTIQSGAVKLSVEPKAKLPTNRPGSNPPVVSRAAVYSVKSESEIEMDRERYRAKKEREDLQRRRTQNAVMIMIATVVFMLIAGGFALKQYMGAAKPKMGAITNEVSRVPVNTNPAPPKMVVQTPSTVANNSVFMMPSKTLNKSNPPTLNTNVLRPMHYTAQTNLPK